MSRWRQKGFVQDSDEEEEESQIESQGLRRDRGLSGRVERVKDGIAQGGAHEGTREEDVKGEKDEGENNKVTSSQKEFEGQERVTTPSKRTSPRRPTLSPFTPLASHQPAREPTESPDPLQSSSPPRIHRLVPSLSTQLLASPNFHHASSLPSLPISQLDDGAAKPPQGTGSSTILPQAPPNVSDVRNSTHTSNILGDFGIAPLSDESSDDDLSDPPSDLESPPTEYIVPHRRTAVQVVIPSSTALQRQIADERASREFRQRKPIQLHPYALEGELYRREVQSRGLKPVRRERSQSPQGHRRQDNDETQEREFHPDQSPTSSPPELEIPVSTPVHSRSKKVAQRPSSDRRPTSDPIRRVPSTQLRHPHAAKRRKLNFSLTQGPAAPATSIEDHGVRRDVWSIPPNSPPYSSSPPFKGTTSAHPLDRLRVTTPGPNLPTPSTSSVILDDAQQLPDSDPEPVLRSIQRSGGELRRPQPVIIGDSSSSASGTCSESEQSDHDLRQVGRKIKGVLPASWLRFDRQAQERRQARQRERERAQSNVIVSLEPTEPLRGVAQRVSRPSGRPRHTSASKTSSRNLLVISDESEDELRAPPPRSAQSIQTSVEDTSALAAIFDNRYAADDLSDMEHDRLHLPTLGGAGPERKRQTKLTDAFGSVKRLKSSKGVAKLTDTGGRSHSGHTGRKKYGSSRSVRHTPTAAMSVVDVDLSPARGSDNMPAFLRIARRQALRRPDLARQSPKNKQIRLHNARDTEEANLTLQQWQQGTLKPRLHVVSRRHNVRRPLVDRTDNQQEVAGQSTADARSSRGVDRHSEAGTDLSHTRRRKNVPRSLRIFQRSSTQRTKSTQRVKSHQQLVQGYGRPIHRDPLPFRAAQLEGDENDFGRGHRKIAFEKGLLRVDQQFGLQLPREQPFVNPQLARYLADDDANRPPLPSADDIGEVEVEAPEAQVPVGTRRLKRKTHAQRIDVDAREYRQPSEPAVEEILRPAYDLKPQEDAEHELPVLHGLGPYGTRYPITFDVHSLASGTYFHSTTFIGHDEFRQALSTGKSTGRDLDDSAGYCTITHGAISVRCGAWNDETSSRLHDLTRSVMAPVETNDNEEIFSAAKDLLPHSARILRAMIGYMTNHLSFLDPVDRKDFVVKMIQIAQELFEGICTVQAALSQRASASDYAQNHVRAMAYLIVVCLQLHRIAQHSTVDSGSKVEILSTVKNVSKHLVTQTVREGISQLGNFLEKNKRQSVRETGVQDNDEYVESTVICMQTLDEIDMPAWGFWDLVSGELCAQAAQAIHISSFETMWATLFTLLPFIEVDISGIPVRSRKVSFLGDSWTCIRDFLRRLFELYPSTHRKHSNSFNDYVRANLARCHRLLTYWHWKRPDLMLNTVFDFFGKNGLTQLRREAGSGSMPFLDSLAAQQLLALEPNENSFHVSLKCLALGLQGMRDAYPEKKIRSFVFRTLPNHGRAYPKDQPLDEESLVALRNHHDLLGTLYWAAPPQCRPKLDHIRDLVNHESSHREACRVSVRAWANLTTFQLSTEESYMAAKPFALWHKDIMHHTLKQYRLAKIEADDYLTSGALDGTSDVSAVMVRQTMERNQEQVIATLRDCIAGMRKAIQHARDQALLRTFLIDSDIMHLLELPHLEDRRLVNVIRDTLKVLQDYTRLRKAMSTKEVSQQTSEESQDYGDFPDMDELDDMDSTIAARAVQQSGLDFIQTPLWHLLSNAFGAEISPDENLLMDCVDTWVGIAEGHAASGERSWSYYVDSFSPVSWKQLRQTEQTRKFEPYFMAALVNCDNAVYEQHRYDFFQALLLCLVERESLLRFQYRLLLAIAQIDRDHPLMQNLPFFRKQENDDLDITPDTLRTRRLALTSSFLSNMRDIVQNTSRTEPSRTAEVKRFYATMLKDFMTTMKHNYQQLRQGTTVTGAYVKFVQKIVQFLKQYTNDICPVLPFFTDSVAFPLPAGDPTYVVARLCGYAPKLSDAGTAKQLSVFIQTVVQQAAADNQQAYLVNQLTTALCTDEAPATDRMALRSTLLQGVFPAYLEGAFSSSTAFVIARPILQALPSILDTMIYDLRITQPDSLSSVIGCILSVSHAFIRGLSQPKAETRLNFLQQPHILSTLSHMLKATQSLLPLLTYITERTMSSAQSTKPQTIVYIENFSIWLADALHNTSIPDTPPSYFGDARAAPAEKQHRDLLAFCRRGLEDSIKTNWSEGHGVIWFGQGHARREVMFEVGSVEEEGGRLLVGIEAFQATVRDVYDGEQEDLEKESRRGIGGDVVV